MHGYAEEMEQECRAREIQTRLKRSLRQMEGKWVIFFFVSFLTELYLRQQFREGFPVTDISGLLF